jgi:hypothetical protein
MRPGPARTSFRIQHLIVLGMLAQAVLAGFFIYTQATLIHLHRQVGSLLLALSLVVLVLAALSRFDPRHGLVPLATVQLVLAAGQFALGLAGRDFPLAAALHVPNAFIVFTVSMLWLVRARRAITGEA